MKIVQAVNNAEKMQSEDIVPIHHHHHQQQGKLPKGGRKGQKVAKIAKLDKNTRVRRFQNKVKLFQEAIFFIVIFTYLN